MSIRAAAATVAVGEGVELNVSALCREAGVARKTFYKWVGRYRAEGLAGLEERSRRPRSSPTQTPGAVEDRIVRLRKELADGGLDHGATTIHWHLSRDRLVKGSPPSVATIHRVLVRRGLVVPQPHKRPKSSWQRFEAPAPNEWWQIDFTEWLTLSGPVKVFNIIDDHSRVLIAARAFPEATSDNAWVAFGAGVQRWGLPAGVLSDNGLAFSGKLRGFEVAFEANLRDAGVRPFTSRPYHPQTCGKVERFQRTEKQWLAKQPPAGNHLELQEHLDAFAELYNHHRPHQGIGRTVPAQRWAATPPAQPSPLPLAHPNSRTHQLHTTVSDIGTIRVDGLQIHLGVEWTGQPATVHLDATHANVFIDGQLVRHLELDRTRPYQPSGRKRGGPRRPRLPSP